MTALKLTSIAAALAVASATALAQQPDQRAIELAQSVADQAAAQQPKAATTTSSGATRNALLSALSALIEKKGAGQ